MPTILRFHGFNIVIYTFDHEPAHVHAIGHGAEIVFLLNCEGAPVQIRGRKNSTAAQESVLTRFITEKRSILCEAWEKLHGE